VNPHSNYVILSYDMLRNNSILDAIMAETWDHLILDEAHYLKDPKGNQRTRPICAPDCLPSVVGRVTMLSGTIMPNQPIECYNAIRLLDHEAINGASLADFTAMYYDYGEGWVTRRRWNLATNSFEFKREWSDNVRNVPTNLADLQHRLRSRIMVRRLKEDVLPQLPPKQWHPFPLMTDARIRKAAAHPGWSAAEQLYEMDPGAFASIPPDGAISTARREMGEAKAPAVAAYIEDLLQEGVNKVVVATWHNSVIDYLSEKLKKHGLVRMDGSMSTTRKQACVDQFQTNPGVRIIIGQMKVLGLGWTLTEAQDVVFAEFDYVPGNNDQFLDRIHRQGQKGDHVLGHVPLAAGTMEERIMGSSIAKAKVSHGALDA
jgi:SNF2 family DNA or RNA helicase